MRLSILYKYKYFALEKSRVSHERNRGEARDRLPREEQNSQELIFAKVTNSAVLIEEFFQRVRYPGSGERPFLPAV